MHQSIKFSVTGDSLAVKRLCMSSSQTQKIRNLLTSSDVCFTNLETSIHRYEPEIFPSRFSGGDWVAAPPEVLSDMKWLGFNLFGIPNNHSLDWSHPGLIRTIENLEKAEIVFAGVGRNLAGACAPAYLETAGGRVALIACNSSFEPWHMAGEQRRDLHGRPGIFGIEFNRIQLISSKELSLLENLHQKMQRESDGWIETDGIRLFRFGNYLYQQGTQGELTQVCHKSLELLSNSIHEAERQADLVVVSLHSHERHGLDPHIPAAFQRELAHFSIEQGAHVFIAHGPHVLRGVEIYKECPIFHGMGNFFYQCELLPKAPAEFYSKFGDFDEKACTADIYDYRVSNGGILGETNPDYFHSAIASFSMQNGKLRDLKIYPISLQFSAHRASKGSPILANTQEADAIFSQIEKLSAAYGTYFIKNNGFLELSFSE